MVSGERWGEALTWAIGKGRRDGGHAKALWPESLVVDKKKEKKTTKKKAARLPKRV